MYQIEQKLDGRWWKIGKPFGVRQEADAKVLQYMEQGQQYGNPRKSPGFLKRPDFRIVLVK
jgi:hypothetical protein